MKAHTYEYVTELNLAFQQPKMGVFQQPHYKKNINSYRYNQYHPVFTFWAHYMAEAGVICYIVWKIDDDIWYHYNGN